MRSRTIYLGVLPSFIGFMCLSIFATPADAKRRKHCMTDHFHYGSSNGHKTKKAARAEAISSWRDFTVFEYGNAWGSFRRARSKGIGCRREDRGWGCNVEAVPCR